MKRLSLIAMTTFALISILATTMIANEIMPNKIWAIGQHPVGHYSDRTLVVSLEVDSSSSHIISFTAKKRPFDRPLILAEPEAISTAGQPQLEVVLQ